MHVSMNELKAALRRCFEACGYYVGNYEDAAAMILWLEKHGLQGLDELQRVLPYIQADANKAFSQVLYEDDTSAVIDVQGRSALNCLAACVDLAHAKAINTGLATVKVLNCHNRIFILKALTDCGRRGASLAAYWQNGSQSIREHCAAIHAGQRYPSYSEALLSQDAALDAKQTLTIICSTRINLSTALQPEQPVQQGWRYLSPEQIASHKSHSLDHGLQIAPQLWEEINRIGTGVLVANSDRSRMGAGGR
ncbi:DUF3726 domain-containing protein [Balneatrix alpica]|uniref:DUF3726 domain-containing protein n=1 Tax=Balneatrix alpica TaxID=75684 RepID=A0ABV5ZAB3_9GAMM|nr:DUF3726 domain-containing protein [Balneatrix alpica]